MKRINGSGSVYKLQDNRRKPWAVRIAQLQPDGSFKRVYVGYYAKKTDAVKALEEYNTNPWVDKRDITLSDIYKEWSAIHLGRVARQTADNYRASYKHLTPLHNDVFSDLRTAKLQTLINGVNLSSSTKSKIKLLLNLLYKYAMENDICQKNYAEFLYVQKQETKGNIYRF